MNEELKRKWDEAERTGEPVDIGDIVVCDFCDKDWTNLPGSGGLILQSKAVCPDCNGKVSAHLTRYGEWQYVRAACPAGVSFADFVRDYRGPNSTISVQKGVLR